MPTSAWTDVTYVNENVNLQLERTLPPLLFLFRVNLHDQYRNLSRNLGVTEQIKQSCRARRHQLQRCGTLPVFA